MSDLVDQRAGFRYAPNPRAAYKCPYCNELARLADKDVVVDSWSNVCHLACYDKEVALNTRTVEELL
jgi:hypothetical protein